MKTVKLYLLIKKPLTEGDILHEMASRTQSLSFSVHETEQEREAEINRCKDDLGVLPVYFQKKTLTLSLD